MNIKPSLLTVVIFLSYLVSVACTPDVSHTPESPTVEPADETPEETIDRAPAAALDAALAYVNQHYGDLAPSQDLVWTGEDITPEGLVGAATFRFTAGTCVATVSCPVTAPGAVIYRVVIDEQATGFHWEGDVGARGDVAELSVQTRSPALMPDPIRARDAALAYISERYGVHPS